MKRFSLGGLATTPLLYALAGCLVVIAGMGFTLYRKNASIEGLESAVALRDSKLETANTALEAWRNQTQSLFAAAESNRDGLQQMKALLEAQQASCAAIGRANEQAAARVEQAARKAIASQQSYSKRFNAEASKPRCAAAWKEVEISCPAMSDY